jgi:hypothetical protein
MNIRSVTIRYVGVNSRAGHREYGFEVDGHAGQVLVGIRDVDFATGRLNFQEGPDLCYQKLLQEMGAERSLKSAFFITEDDLSRYRETHAVSGRASSKSLLETRRREA